MTDDDKKELEDIDADLADKIDGGAIDSIAKTAMSIVGPYLALAILDIQDALVPDGTPAAAAEVVIEAIVMGAASGFGAHTLETNVEKGVLPQIFEAAYQKGRAHAIEALAEGYAAIAAGKEDGTSDTTGGFFTAPKPEGIN